MKHYKKHLIIAAVILVAAAIYMGYAWNKPHTSIENVSTFRIDAATLCNAYTQNEEDANKQYLNMALEITGTIASVEKNQNNQTVILLACSDDDFSGIQCTLKDERADITPGATVTVKGFCNGYVFTVLLSDCIVTSVKP